MHISELEMYDLLKERMSEKEAREFINYISFKVEDKFIEAQQVFATKEDLLKLELKITQVISDSRTETLKLISESKIEMVKLVTDSKAETIKWMLVFMTTSSVAIIGTILTAMKMIGW
jgi:hypothetical protein